MVDILRTGLSGLIASQRALATTSHNIANVNTPGYSRQRVELTTNLPDLAGNAARSMYVGTGVQVQSITRVYDDFLTQQVRNHGSNVSQSETLDTWISQLDGILGDSQTGLSPALSQFFAAVQDVADSPASLSARQALLGQASTLAASFQEMNGQMDSLRQGANETLSDTVTQVNVLAENIAKMNGAIALSQGSGTSSDLLDQRDQLVADLAQKVPVSTVTQDDGTLSVFIGNGQSLVLGNQANTLETVRSASDPRKLDIRFEGSNVGINNLLNGGEIGGLLDFQNEVLDPAQNKLGLMAAGLTETFNAQHKLGLDFNGDPGGDFFAPITPEVAANAANTGSGALTVTLSNIGDLQPSDYELSYNGTGYNLRRLSDDQSVSLGAGPPFTAEGMTIAIGGTPAAGDRFLIQPTQASARNFQVLITDPRQFAAADSVGGVGNNANAIKLADLQTDQTLRGGTSSLQDIQSQMVAEVGTQGSGARSAVQAQTALLEQATQARDGFSGVNLDEEAANLMRYQQAYAAAAKVIQVGDSIIQTLLDAVRS